MSARTLFDKLWDAHQVRAETATTPGVLYIDLHMVHEVTSPQAFDELRGRGLKVRRPDRTLATLDHSTPTLPPFTRPSAMCTWLPATLPQLGKQMKQRARSPGRRDS